MFFKRRPKPRNRSGSFNPFPADVDVWAGFESGIAKAPWEVENLHCDPQRSQQVMAQLELTEDSELGAMVAHTGGLVIDHGWVRLLGAGLGDLPDVATASPFTREDPHYLVLGVDVLGGIFAIDGTALGAGAGRLCYIDPTTMDAAQPTVRDLNVSHAQFMAWVLTGDVDKFYAPHRWDDWKEDIAGLSLNHGLDADRQPIRLSDLWEQAFPTVGLDVPRPQGF
ncbi:DUF2625 family protein [Citricoccus muralis]|uniref:DUF2625 family protein n=1 Tax=Citricoccus muralis TaxID=169134 RepID=A0ABY8H538_9MICC|nr:DUF2625 family protein [Citricoccus muralis]WFP16249.1 DUF2625 family protein [Citricoccus muralis]